MDAESAYLFRHALLRDAAYDLQLPADRARLHTLTLQILQELLELPEEDDPPHVNDAFMHELADHAAAAGEWESLRKYLWRASMYAEQHYRPAEVQELTRRLAGLKDLPPERLVPTAIRESDALRQLGNMKAAGEVLERVESAAAEDPALRVDWLLAAAAHLRHSAQGERALELYRQAIDTLEGEPEDRRKSLCLSGQAVVLRELGRTQEAYDYVTRALEVLRRVGDRRMEGRVTGSLGTILSQLGRFAEAGDAYRSARMIAQEYRDRLLEAGCCANLADACKQQGLREESLPLIEEGLRIAMEIGNRRAQVILLNHRATYLAMSGELDAADAAFRETIETAREVGDQRIEGIALGNIAQLLRDSGDLEGSERVNLQAIDHCRKIGNRYTEGNQLTNLGTLYREMDREADAERALRESITIHQETGNLNYEVWARGHLTRLLLYGGRVEEARTERKRALAPGREAWFPNDLEAFEGEWNRACEEAGLDPA